MLEHHLGALTAAVHHSSRCRPMLDSGWRSSQEPWPPPHRCRRNDRYGSTYRFDGNGGVHGGRSCDAGRRTVRCGARAILQPQQVCNRLYGIVQYIPYVPHKRLTKVTDAITATLWEVFVCFPTFNGSNQISRQLTWTGFAWRSVLHAHTTSLHFTNSRGVNHP